MAYKLSWYIEGEVIYVQNSLVSSVQEIRDCLVEINTYIEQSNHPLVHIINDLSHVTKASNLVEIAQAVKEARPHPRMGWTIMVGEQDRLVKFTANVARQLLRVRQRSFETLPEALDFLRDMDTRLDWSKANNTVLVYAAQEDRPSGEEG